MKYISKKVKFLLVLFLMLVAFLFLAFLNEMIFIPDKEKENKEQIKEEKQPLKESDLNKEQLEEYYKVYENPFVRHLRVALNGYLDGTNEGLDPVMIDVLINGLDNEKYDRSRLKNYKEYFKSRFIVFYVDQALGGGMNITVIFQDKPDKIFNFWIYKQEKEIFVLRGFWEVEMDKEQIQKHVKDYEIFIKDEEHSL